MRYYILFIFLLSSSLFSDETENIAVDSLQFHSYFLNSYFNQSNFLYSPVNHYAGLKLFNKSFLPEVRLYLTGNISVNGDLISEDNDLFTSNLNENKTWDLEVEQNQAFRFDVHLGERFKMSLKQDSEEDFSWEDNLKIVYQGKPGEFFQRAEAGGGINFSLPGRYFPILEASKKDSLTNYFGLKTIHQLGPISMYSILARSHTKKIEKHFEGGAQIDSVVIQDYNFIVDRYFFIDDNFKNNFYPLNENNAHVYNQEYVIGEVELFQKVATNESATIVPADAYIDPNDLSSYSVGGTWKKLQEGTDFTIDRLLGYIRLNSVENAIAIAYSTTTFDQQSQSFGNNQNSTGTKFKSVYDECVSANPDTYQDECGDLIILKLLKDIDTSSPYSPTWPLMFKNVYSMGGSNIDPNALEIEILMDQGTDLLTTHSDNGNSYLSIFGLDSEDQNHEKMEGGDGKIDLYGSILNLTHGELILPAYLPFAYDELAKLGNNHDDLNGILPELNEVNLSPAIYYDTNQDDINSQHKFVIKVKTSQINSSMSLGLMVEEGSETVRLDGSILQQDIDYTIDYFSGTITFLNPQAFDPTADINVTYEESDLLLIDQNLYMGTYWKYDFSNNDYIGAGAYYYTQSTANEKIDIGYEPFRNLLWEIEGRYDTELPFLSKIANKIHHVSSDKPSIISLDGNYSQLIHNANPLGQAFIDDFEDAERSFIPSILMNQWKWASQPGDGIHTIYNRSQMLWYNPYEDELTKNIWPEMSTSTRANTQTTKTLHLETYSNSSFTTWNGVTTGILDAEKDMSLASYIDIWINGEGIENNDLVLNIDLGHISEDLNNNGILDTEDEPVYGPGIGDGILSDGEDIGVDRCTDSYEDGWGGCLCDVYDEAAIYGSDLNDIYNHTTEFCLSGLTYYEALGIDSISVNENINNPSDPNGDNWYYFNTSDYSGVNGTEGNGQALGYRYPDSEDLNNNNILDTQNNYFTASLYPTLHKSDIGSMIEQETVNENGDLTGWKLFRIPISKFESVGEPDWSEIQSMRLWVETDAVSNNQLKIARIEFGQTNWNKLGFIDSELLNNGSTEFENDDNRTAYLSTINNEESIEYKNSLNELNILFEHDEYNDIDMKEQSLAIIFENDGSEMDGIYSNEAFVIENVYSSYDLLNYEKLEMYISAESKNLEMPWYTADSENNVEVFLRLETDSYYGDSYYEIRQPLHASHGINWDDRNFININLENLINHKISNRAFLNESGALLLDIDDGIENTCGYCTEIRIKGNDPNLREVDKITIGIINKTNQTIYGQVLLNELRLTAPKKKNSHYLTLETKLNLSDIFQINARYYDVDPDFSNLDGSSNNSSKSRSRFSPRYSKGTISPHDKIRIDMDFKLHNILPEKLGLDVPIKITYGYDDNTDNMIISDLTTIPDSLIMDNNANIYKFRINRNKKSTNPLIHATLDAIEYSHYFSSTKYNAKEIRFGSTSTSDEADGNKSKRIQNFKYKYKFVNSRYLSPFHWLHNVALFKKLSGLQFNAIPEHVGFTTDYKKYYSKVSSLSIQNYGLNNNTNINNYDRSNISLTNNFNLSHRLSDKLKIMINKNMGYLSYENKSTSISTGNDTTYFSEQSDIIDLYLKNNEEDYALYYNTLINDYTRLYIVYKNTFNQGWNYYNSAYYNSAMEENVKIWYSSIQTSPAFSTNINWNFPKLLQKYLEPSTILYNISRQFTLMNIRYAQNHTYDYSNVHKINPGFSFRLGLDSKPNEISYDTTLDGNMYNHNSDNNLSIKQGIHFTRFLFAVFDYKYENSYGRSSSSSSTKSTTISYYPVGHDGKSGFPMVNWNFQLSGLERWPGLRNYFKLIYLTHNHFSNRTEQFASDALMIIEYRKDLAPLIGINLKTKGKKPLLISFNYNTDYTLKVIDDSAESIYDNQAIFGISYNVRNRYVRFSKLSNHFTFSHDLIYSSYTKMLTAILSDSGDIDTWYEAIKDEHLTVNNSLLITFSQYVSGKIYYIYEFNRDKSTGENIIRDYGFNLNIKIQNF